MVNKDKVKVELDKDVVDELYSLKKRGDTYSKVLRRILKLED